MPHVPETSQCPVNEYITGQYALNIHHPEIAAEPTGDWHGFIWDGVKELPNEKVTYAGTGHEINTFEIWGTQGVFDDKKHFEKRGIVARATEDFFDTAQQKLFIIRKINRARKHLTKEAVKNLDRWIDHEINYEQYRSKESTVD
jgi:hypothetical protein